MSILAQVIMCVLVADFMTGLVHWVEDTYGVPSWPIIGKLVIEDNIEHHRRPNLIGKMGTFFSRNLQPTILGLITISIFLAFGVFCWQILLVSFLAAMGNEVHAWNHRRNNHWLIGSLQRSGLIQSRHQHNLHHKPPYDKYYCTLTGVTNEILEMLNFWRRLEWVISIFGIHHKRQSPERSGY